MSQESHLAPGATVAPCPLDQRWAIEVVVIDEEDHPLSGIAVQLSRSRNEVLLDRTDSKGAVRFERLLAGNYQLTLPLVDEKAWACVQVSSLENPHSSGTAEWVPPPDAPGRPSHKVELGDCLASIGFESGFLPETLWNHNPQLHQQERRRRILNPGDVIVFPELSRRHQDAATGNRYRLRRKAVPERLNIRFVNYRGQPRAGVAFVLHVETASGTAVLDKTGTLDGDGFIRQPLPPDATMAEITLSPPGEPQEIIEVQLGYVNSVEAVSGAKARLNNLYYFVGPENEELDEITEEALSLFQRDNQLPVTGKLDGPTREALKGQHLS